MSEKIDNLAKWATTASEGDARDTIVVRRTSRAASFRAAIRCLTPSPADMLRYDAEQCAIVDPCEDGWPVIALWSKSESGWIDPAGRSCAEWSDSDIDLFDDLRRSGSQ